MNPQVFPAFIHDSMRHVPAIRRALLYFSQNGRDAADLSGALEVIRSILSSSRMLGLAEIENFAAALEAEITGLMSGGLYNDRIASALDLLSKLEATLLKASLDDDNFSLDIDQVFDEPFPIYEEVSDLLPDIAPPPPIIFSPEPLPMVAPPQPEPVRFEAPPGGDEFEIDPELLEIFAEEASELLRNIDSSLESLAADPNDSDSLWEIRRNAHTFKGSAGIVGLKQLSELAHRIEDMLDRLAETKSGSNARIFEVLHRSTACLKALVGGDNSPELFKSISQLYYDFDGVLAWLNEPQTIVAETRIVEETVAQPVEVPAAAPSADHLAIAERIFAPAHQPSLHKPVQAKSVVRVSLGRLDELVRIVRDLIISRSTFEQNLKNLERQIDDLHNTTRRLQSTSSKLEIDFEASMMGSGSPILGTGFGSGLHVKPDGFDDLEFDQYTEFHQSTRELAETASDAFSINTSLDTLRGSFESLLDEQHRLVDDLQEKLMRIRMVEFGSLSTRLQRAVRVTCEEENKKAQIKIENETLEIDTQILDSLIEPLMHLLKNAVVHGIEDTETRLSRNKPEQGVINVSVRNEETHIVLSVSDDGRGISAAVLKEKAVAMGQLSAEAAETMSDDDALDLIFLAGLSTAERLNLSAGRGVGMSIVKESISAARGTITIDSTPHQGTTFTVRMPLALPIANVLLVKSANGLYALPTKLISYIAELSDEMFAGIDGQKVEVLGKKQPLYQLSALLGHDALPPAALLGKPSVLFGSPERSCMITVDDIVSSEEVVIKPLAKPLDQIPGILGAAILGNGALVPIIDLPSMLRKKIRRPRVERVEPKIEAPKTVSILVVDDSPSVRHLTSKVIQGAGWNVKTAKDGIDALEQLKAAEELPDVILSDIEMPRMDGYELAASLQRSDVFRSIPVIVITSRSAEKHRDKAMENGVSHYLTKPYEDKELIEAITRLANIT